jgi:hypothetical protein
VYRILAIVDMASIWFSRMFLVIVTLLGITFKFSRTILPYWHSKDNSAPHQPGGSLAGTAIGRRGLDGEEALKPFQP